MFTALLLATALAAPPIVLWSWEDPAGTVHYTENSATIPSDARKVQAFRLAERAESTASQPGLVAANTPAPAGNATTTLVVHGSQGRVWQDSNGLDEAQWRDRFIDAHRKIESLQTRLAAAQALPLSPVHCTESFCVANPEFERVQALQVQLAGDLEDARGDLVQLDRVATRLGVPREWRRGW